MLLYHSLFSNQGEKQTTILLMSKSLSHLLYDRMNKDKILDIPPVNREFRYSNFHLTDNPVYLLQ